MVLVFQTQHFQLNRLCAIKISSSPYFIEWRGWKIRRTQFRSPAPKKLIIWFIYFNKCGSGKTDTRTQSRSTALRRSLYFSECRVWKTKPLPLAQNRRSLFCSIFHHCFIENRNYRVVIYILLHRESKS